jgi:hypothetical protein
MYSALSDEDTELSVFMSAYTISDDSSNNSDMDSDDVGETLYNYCQHILTHQDTEQTE